MPSTCSALELQMGAYFVQNAATAFRRWERCLVVRSTRCSFGLRRPVNCYWTSATNLDHHGENRRRLGPICPSGGLMDLQENSAFFVAATVASGACAGPVWNVPRSLIDPDQCRNIEEALHRRAGPGPAVGGPVPAGDVDGAAAHSRTFMDSALSRPTSVRCPRTARGRSACRLCRSFAQCSIPARGGFEFSPLNGVVPLTDAAARRPPL